VTWPVFVQKVEYTLHCSGICICDIFHAYVCNDSFVRVELLIDTYDMTQQNSRHASRVCVTCSVWHDSFICVTWLIHLCDLAHWHVLYSVPDGLYYSVCDTTHSYLWHGAFVCATWPHSCVWHASSIHATCLIHIPHTTHAHLRDMPHSYVWHDACHVESRKGFITWNQLLQEGIKRAKVQEEKDSWTALYGEFFLRNNRRHTRGGRFLELFCICMCTMTQ